MDNESISEFVNREINEHAAQTARDYDDKLATFFAEYWPDMFGRDPITFGPRKNPSVLETYDTVSRRRAEQTKIIHARSLLEHAGYSVTKQQLE